MKMMKSWVLLLAVLLTINADAQSGRSSKTSLKSPANEDLPASKLSITGGAGIANYFGDLIQGNKFYSQPNYSFSAGALYTFTNHINARFDMGIHKIQASDSKNKAAQYKARNLSFKSNIFDMSVSAEYGILDLHKYKVSPFISAGIGLTVFTPYANDISGKKYSLRELGTEGQGLAGYPDKYSRTTIQFPLGFGLKYPINDELTLQFEFNYRFTGTDYLDDVSTAGYPDKALLDARNPVTAKFTWRGNEIGGEAYPKNLNLPRGNPNDKDGYYTTQIKMVVKL